MKRISTFLSNYYWEQFFVLYKSYLYYNHETPFRVYDYLDLTEEQVKTLQDIGIEVITVKQDDYPDWLYKSKYCFKWKGLIESDCDKELVIDADTIFLDNVDDVIDLVDDYEFVVVPEYYGEHRADCLFNIGFFVTKKESKYRLQQSIDYCKENKGDHAITEMISLCRIMKHENVLELPWEKYQHLWWNHRLPKSLSIEDGKFVVKNEDGSRLRFYHLTTHIDPYKGSNILRFNLEKELTSRMWVKRFDNPVGLIYNYFDNYETLDTVHEKIEEWRIK